MKLVEPEYWNNNKLLLYGWLHHPNEGTNILFRS